MNTTNLPIRAGETATIVIGPITDDDTGDPVALAGISLTFAAKSSVYEPDADAAIVLTTAQMTVDPDPLAGDSVTIELTPTLTRPLLGTYNWVLTGEDVYHEVRSIAGGTLTVTRTAWRGA